MGETEKKVDATGHRFGSRALSTIAMCGVLGFPLLLAFGLGVLMWMYGLLAGLVLGIQGLRCDEHRGRAWLALAMVGAAALWITYVRSTR